MLHDLYGMDANNNACTTRALSASATERNVYSIRIKWRSSKVTLAGEKGRHNATFTPDMRLFVNSFSAEGQPTRVPCESHETGRKNCRTIKTNERAEKALETIHLHAQGILYA